jgi:N utilization substance protein B
VGARTKARKRAVDVLFEADQRGVSPVAVLEAEGQRSDRTLNPYTLVLVEGVVDRMAEIDALLATHSVEWPVDRMPAVDRAILRLGTYELLWGPEVPPAVAIDEAVELAKGLSTDDSPGFVNGVLGKIAANPRP